MPANDEQMKKRNRQTALTITAAIVGALLIFGGGSYLFTRAFTGHVTTPSEYPTMQLEAAEYSDEMTADGTIKSSKTTTVSTKVEGTVTNVAVEEGDKVSKGDLLFQMENEMITESVSTTLTSYTKAQDEQAAAQKSYDKGQAKLDAAKKSQSKAEASYEKAEARAEAKQEEDPDYEFDSEPYENAIELAQASVKNAEDNVATLKTALEKAQSGVTDAKKEYEKAKKNQGNLQVKATSSGVVSELEVQTGDSSAKINAAGGAMKIVDMSALTCVVQVPESQINNVQEGQTATVTCNGVDGEIAATVARVGDTPSKTAAASTPQGDGSNSADAQGSNNQAATDSSAVYDVTLDIPKASKKVKVGMSATASILIQNYGSVYYLPASAVGNNLNGSYVECVSDEYTTKEYSVNQIGTADDGRLIVQGALLTPGMNIRTDLS